MHITLFEMARIDRTIGTEYGLKATVAGSGKMKTDCLMSKEAVSGPTKCLGAR